MSAFPLSGRQKVLRLLRDLEFADDSACTSDGPRSHWGSRQWGTISESLQHVVHVKVSRVEKWYTENFYPDYTIGCAPIHGYYMTPTSDVRLNRAINALRSKKCQEYPRRELELKRLVALREYAKKQSDENPLVANQIWDQTKG